MQRFELNEEIYKPIEEVWQFLIEPYFAQQWMKDVEGIVRIGDQPITKGTKLRSCRQFVGRRIWTNIEVTEFEENEVFELFSDDRDVRSRYTYRLTPQEEGPVKLQLVVEYQIKGFAAFFSGVFDRLIEEHEVDHLERFKIAIEPEQEVDYTPKVVHLSEIISSGPSTVSESSPPVEAEAPEEEKAPEAPEAAPQVDDDDEPKEEVVVKRRVKQTTAEADTMIVETLSKLEAEDVSMDEPVNEAEDVSSKTPSAETERHEDPDSPSTTESPKSETPAPGELPPKA